MKINDFLAALIIALYMCMLSMCGYPILHTDISNNMGTFTTTVQNTLLEEKIEHHKDLGMSVCMSVWVYE